MLLDLGEAEEADGKVTKYDAVQDRQSWQHLPAWLAFRRTRVELCPAGQDFGEGLPLRRKLEGSSRWLPVCPRGLSPALQTWRGSPFSELLLSTCQTPEERRGLGVAPKQRGFS